MSFSTIPSDDFTHNPVIECNGDPSTVMSGFTAAGRSHASGINAEKRAAADRGKVRGGLDFRTFVVDPDEGHAKVLRIYAGGPNRRERMFEYRDGSVIDGALFRGRGRGDWGGVNDHWSGKWEGEEREERERDRQR